MKFSGFKKPKKNLKFGLFRFLGFLKPKNLGFYNLSWQPCARLVIGDVFCCSIGGLPAANQTQKDFFDRIELGGVDARIGAHVQICDGYRHVVTALAEIRVWVQVKIQVIGIGGKPG